MMNLKSYLTNKRELIKNTLLSLINERFNNIHSRLIAAMNYSLMAGGKRLRPILFIASYESIGSYQIDSQNTQNLIPACCIEMIHTYSLIHDDLPAMDNDDLRRGKPTCHVEFDEATAILAGDALLTASFEILSSYHDKISKDNALKWLRIINILSHAAGYNGMVEGQMRDILAEGKELTLDELKDMHYLKTGAMIEASVSMGAILAGGNTQQIEKLNIFAKNIGLAFQVADDILNIEGDPNLMGKAVGTDMDRHKATYPALLGLEKSKLFAKNLVNQALEVISDFDKRSEPLRSIAKYIIERKK